METTFDAKTGLMTLKVPITDASKAPLSASGKNKVNFTTGGFVYIAGSNLRINLTIISKP